MSCSTGSTGSEGSQRRKGSPGKGSTQAVSEEGSQAGAFSGRGHRLMKARPHGAGPLTLCLCPTLE